MLAGVPLVILAGIVSQIVSLKIVGPTHQFSIWYVTLMAILWFVNTLALILHLYDRTKAGVLIAAWCSLVCVSAMVYLDTMADKTDGFPWVILTLYLASYAVGEVVSGKASLVYSTACGIILISVGIAQGRMDDAIPSLLVLLLVVVWSWRSFYVGCKLEEYREAIRIITDGKRRHTGSH